MNMSIPSGKKNVIFIIPTQLS